MKIVEIEIIPFEIPYQATDVRTSLGRHVSLRNVLVNICSDTGVSGWGETAPLPAFSGESQESVVAVLQHTICPWLLGRDPCRINDIILGMDQLMWDQHFAKCAVDFALHDLLAKSLDVPLVQLLGGKIRERMPLAWTIGWKSTEKTIEEAAEAVRKGFQAIKLKVGNPDHSKDLKRLHRVRETVGNDIPIRIDANQGYNTSHAVKRLGEMELCNIQLVEQPVFRRDIAGLKRVRDALKCPIMADESVTSPADVFHLASHNAVDVINLKPQKFGGLVQTGRVAAVASAANLDVFPSSRMCSGVGVAAATHFYASLPSVDYEGEFVDGVLIAEDDLLTDPIPVADGHVTVPDGPGIGAEIDGKKIERYAKARISVRQ